MVCASRLAVVYVAMEYYDCMSNVVKVIGFADDIVSG